MPSVSKKQHNLMAMVAHDPKAAKRIGIPQSVGKDFSSADKGKKFRKGGPMKESKEMAAAEMKALKKGHAPKEVLAHERKEHKEMGYKHGGRVAPHPAKVTKAETHQKPFGMAETPGGRKEPHSKKKGLEGDTHLKSFGMGKGQGHGRSVHRAKAPKDETKQRGFAMEHDKAPHKGVKAVTKGAGMKKGGHVKHHAKGGKAGGHKKHAGIDPAALAARLGPAAGMGGPMAPGPGAMPPAPGGPPPGGPPGMKKGGHVITHHHHYAHGGDVRHEDGAAERGHTKGKQVKMAHGGHVGSHPHRRGDGCASKGHTRGRNV